jgi:aryl-alcohol dehydrogenase-like predicted oxidoreductase
MTDFKLAQVRLGTDGPLVGQQGFGAMGIKTDYYGTTDETEARAALEQALSLGITLFDTADAYGNGSNEEFLAPFLAAHRDEVVIATKFGLDNDRPGIFNDPAYIRAAVDHSLRRLGVDHIDVYYLHRRDVNVPIEQTVGVMASLVAAGKVRHLGLSEVTADELRAAYAIHPIAAVESEWSLFSRDIETRVVPAAAALGTALVPYSPLGRGILTGQVPSVQGLEAGDVRRAMPRFAGGNDRANHDLLAPVRDVAAAHDATPPQIALAWLHAQQDVLGLPVVPIPGTRTSARVAENAAGARIALTADELKLLDPLAAQVTGERYADMTFASGGRES